MQRVIQSKKDALVNRKLGTVTSGEPKVIWCKMLKTEDIRVRNPFNKALAEVLQPQKEHYLMEVDREVDLNQHTSVTGELDAEGRIHFWQAVNKIIKRFEYQEISLKLYIPDRKVYRRMCREEQHKPLNQKRSNSTYCRHSKNFDKY